MPAMYRSSRLFAPIRNAEAEARAARLLDRLYVSNRCHYGLQPRCRRVFRADLAWFCRHVKPPARVLECGAGTGTFAAMLAERGFDVTAADRYGEADLARLQRHYAGRPNLRLRRIERVLASGQRFDAVVSVSVLEHLLRPDRALRRWSRLLTDGGVLAVVCPNYAGLLTPLRIAARGVVGRSTWRYASPAAALGHAAENLLLDLHLWATGRPCFVRCMPMAPDGQIRMTDSDVDAVHLPSARGIRNYLLRNGLRVLSWRAGPGGRPLGDLLGRLLPAWAPTVRIVAAVGPEARPPANADE
jgi:2-polyprenyl-3-methyl-5-hydroxy-6-metoxy-1,4-benzoquinol methylase